MADAKARRRDQAEAITGVAGYKILLQRVLEARPSGTRQRIAAELGKNRSFVTQITSPSYETPIPARHVDRILEICHFSPAEREAFLAAYHRAHPGRQAPPRRSPPRTRAHVVRLPDLGSTELNGQLDTLIGELAERLAHLIVRSKD
jgi:hypothetical protein